ncbi:MAG: hypothetical protein K2N38_05610 [Oscillospiraceae bacterium]|nr:hypothetical protein [Oscillospiraceae bacterium]
MVWNSTQSALYKVIDAHNTCVSGSVNDTEKNIENLSKKYRESERKSGRENEQKCPCENCPKNRSKNRTSDPLSTLLSDRDMLLIAALIFVLIRENADKALILALVVVLLG